MGYNRCIFEGNLGKDAELRTMPSGDGVVNFSVGANESWKNKDGEKQERCEWVNCTLFGKRGPALMQYLVKGSRVLVEGKLRTETYDKDGEKRYATKLIIDDVVLLGDRRGGDSEEKPGRSPAPAPRQEQSYSGSSGGGGGRAPQQQDLSSDDGGGDDEIPFIRNAIDGRWDRP